jgi:hypothetical protein
MLVCGPGSKRCAERTRTPRKIKVVFEEHEEEKKITSTINSDRGKMENPKS